MLVVGEQHGVDRRRRRRRPTAGPERLGQRPVPPACSPGRVERRIGQQPQAAVFEHRGRAAHEQRGEGRDQKPRAFSRPGSPFLLSTLFGCGPCRLDRHGAPHREAAAASLPAVSSPIVATGPLVERDSITFRLPDPDEELAGVRLATDRGFPLVPDPFMHEERRMDAADGGAGAGPFRVRRSRSSAPDGSDEHWSDPANPLRAPRRIRREVGRCSSRATPNRCG